MAVSCTITAQSTTSGLILQTLPRRRCHDTAGSRWERHEASAAFQAYRGHRGCSPTRRNKTSRPSGRSDGDAHHPPRRLGSDFRTGRSGPDPVQRRVSSTHGRPGLGGEGAGRPLAGPLVRSIRAPAGLHERRSDLLPGPARPVRPQRIGPAAGGGRVLGGRLEQAREQPRAATSGWLGTGLERRLVPRRAARQACLAAPAATARARVQGKDRVAGRLLSLRVIRVNRGISMLTLLEALLSSLERAADYNRDDAVAPAVVLWTDEKREWESLVLRFRQALPHYFVLGPYDTANRAGPAIWLRCVLAGKMPEISWPTTS